MVLYTTYNLFTVYLENLVHAPFKKNLGKCLANSAAFHLVGSATEMRADIGHAYLCMLQYSVAMVALIYCTGI